MGEVWRIGRRVPLNIYGEPTDEWPEGRPICQCHNADDARRIIKAVNIVTEVRWMTDTVNKTSRSSAG